MLILGSKIDSTSGHLIFELIEFLGITEELLFAKPWFEVKENL